MTEELCGAIRPGAIDAHCDMRAGHPPVEGHFDTHLGVEWR
jgi:hypothetical protein